MFSEVVVYSDKVKRGDLRTEGRWRRCASDMFSDVRERVMYLCREVVETFVRFVIRVYPIKVNEILPDGLMSLNDKIYRTWLTWSIPSGTSIGFQRFSILIFPATFLTMIAFLEFRMQIEVSIVASNSVPRCHGK